MMKRRKLEIPLLNDSIEQSVAFEWFQKITNLHLRSEERYKEIQYSEKLNHYHVQFKPRNSFTYFYW